jgi:lipopolysaccharide export system protein LptA
MPGRGVGARALVAGIFIAVAAGGMSAVAAQTTNNVPNAVQGFSQNRDVPVQIEALSLEVREKDKLATFTGEVNVVQGDTNLKCKSLVVFYEGDVGSEPGMKSATPGPGGNQQLRRLEAKGGVVITQKEQTASGDTAIFDMRANTITLAGNVVVTQGQNILRGDRLVVDMTNGVSRVESAKSADGRVRALILPGSTPKPEAQAAAKPDPLKTGAIKQEAQAKPEAARESRRPGAARPLN